MITKDKIIIKQKGDQIISYKGGFMDNNLKNLFALPVELNIFTKCAGSRLKFQFPRNFIAFQTPEEWNARNGIKIDENTPEYVATYFGEGGSAPDSVSYVENYFKLSPSEGKAQQGCT